MGRKMIKCAASEIVSVSSTSDTSARSDDYKKNGRDVLSSEASMEYLCNLPPHRLHLVNTPKTWIIPDITCIVVSYDKI
jgi:L-arabinokinase